MPSVPTTLPIVPSILLATSLRSFLCSHRLKHLEKSDRRGNLS